MTSENSAAHASANSRGPKEIPKMFVDAFSAPQRQRVKFGPDELGSRWLSWHFRAAYRLAWSRAKTNAQRERLVKLARDFERRGRKATFTGDDFEFVRELAGPWV